MNLQEFIKELSLKDKKNLQGKFTKLIEETGELARVILPFESAHGTNHRFTDREDILEELVDIHLCNVSILHSLGFTEEEFEEMLTVKSKKWSQLQANEERGFPLPFEIHISINTKYESHINSNIHTNVNGLKEFNYDKFVEVCEKIGVKPIILDLEVDKDSIRDVMTSSKHFGDNRSAYEECIRISKELDKHGYFIIRKKIETTPWHPAAPSLSKGKIENDCYFESHIGVSIRPEHKDSLSSFVKSLSDIIDLSGNARLSRNFFKKSKDGRFINMLTYRSNDCGSIKFKMEVQGIKSLLEEHGFDFEKVEIEYAIYDTNISHDAKWITG